MNLPLSARPLAPSEIAYLHGERFEGLGGRTKRVLGSNVPLLHAADRKMPAPDLALGLLATAALANVREGAVRLETREKREMLGLRKVQSIYFEQDGAPPAWPAGSLEAAFLPAVARAKTREADAVFAELLADTTSDGWQHAIELVRRGLSERGLLELKETRTMKVFKTQSWVLPEETLRRARAEDVERVLDLVERLRKDAPDSWEILEREITQAVNRRTQSDDDHDWD